MCHRHHYAHPLTGIEEAATLGGDRLANLGRKALVMRTLVLATGIGLLLTATCGGSGASTPAKRDAGTPLSVAFATSDHANGHGRRRMWLRVSGACVAG